MRWNGQSLEIAVVAQKVLGEVPIEWYDEDGKLLPEHCDDNGELRLASHTRGKPGG